MCESSAYLKKDDGEELLLEDVTYVRPKDGQIVMSSLFGDEVIVDADIIEIDLMAHKIVLQKR